MDKSSLFGLMILAFCLTVALCAPQSKDSPLNEYQDDDYEYDDDQNSSSQQGTTATTTNGLQPYFLKSEETVAGIIGKEVTLKCDAQNLKDNVILWYKGKQVVLTKNLLTPNYKLVQNDMVILNATEESQGDYYCHVEPHKIRKHFHVIMGDHPMEAIVPESSTSGSSTIYSSVLCAAVTLSSLRLFQR